MIGFLNWFGTSELFDWASIYYGEKVFLSFKYCLKVAVQRIIVKGSALHVALCVDSFVVRITVRGLVKFKIL